MTHAVTRRNALITAASLLAHPAFAATAMAETLQPLSVADGPFDAIAGPYYARAQGFFAAHGLAVTIENASSNGAAVVAAVLGGSIEVGFSNIGSLVISHARGIPITIIAPTGLYRSSAPITSMMVPLRSTIETAQDLDGKTIAVNGIDNLSQYAPEAWIDQHGGNSKNVKFLEMAGSAMPAALANDRIDAAVVTEPFIGPAKKVARIFCNPFDAIAPTFMIAGFFTTRDWARGNRDLVHRFQSALRETARWANANPDRTADILADLTHTDAASIRAMNRSIMAEHLDPATVQPVIDKTAHYGNFAPFNAGELIFTG